MVPSWWGIHIDRQRRHGGRTKRLACHTAFTLRKQRINRKFGPAIKPQDRFSVTHFLHWRCTS